jgi:hypothetical protein
VHLGDKEHHLFGLVAARHHAHVHGHPTPDVGGEALVQGTQSLFFRDASHGIANTFVTTPFGLDNNNLG